MQPTHATVNLQNGIKIGEKTISEISLRKPKAGELRGIKILDLLQMDTTAYFQLLPRICEPAITEAQIAALETEDLIVIMGAVTNFFTYVQ